MDSWVQLPPAHGYASPRTMKVRGLVQSMVSTSDARDWTYRAHEGSGQERPLAGGSGTDTDGRRSRGVTNYFHVPMNVSRVGTGRGNGRPVAAVKAGPRRLMHSDTYRKPSLGTFKSMRRPMRSGAGKRWEAYCFTASTCLVRIREG